MTTSKPLSERKIAQIERGIDDLHYTGDDVQLLINEIRRQRAVLDQIDAQAKRIDAGLDRVSDQTAELLTALTHLDKIINAYQSTNALGPMLIAIREAKEWRGIKTSQDAPGATQST